MVSLAQANENKARTIRTLTSDPYKQAAIVAILEGKPTMYNIDLRGQKVYLKDNNNIVIRASRHMDIDGEGCADFGHSLPYKEESKSE